MYLLLLRLLTATVPSRAVQVYGSSSIASISPEFLASEIQAIQTPISAIVQHSLIAAVSFFSSTLLPSQHLVRPRVTAYLPPLILPSLHP